MNFPKSIEKYPIYSHLENICNTLKSSKSRSLVLTAETGAGKSTILPLAFLQKFPGKILMTEPRRLSVLGVANRVSSLLEEDCGKTVGYQIHLEKKLSEQTRFQVVTEAVLVKMLQEDEALENFNLVVLDEFHERSVQLDLALAFLKEAMLLREDLFVVVMSATINAKKIAEFLSKDCEEETPVIQVPGKTYPVEIFYEDNAEVEKVVVREAAKLTGEIEPQTLLVFLPGIKELRKCHEKVSEVFQVDADFNKTDLYILHSSTSLEEQRQVLVPSKNHRVILSSAIAETSLTIPGVSVVIDSGLSRVNRLNIATGMEGLFTERESVFSSEQRAGRAGREKPGKCIRLWNQFDVRQKEQDVEILRTDLVPVVLECAERGIQELEKIDWLDKPNSAAWKTSKELLENLGCIQPDGKITEKGRNALKLSIHPRLACILLAGGSLEIALKYSNYANSSEEVKKRFLQDLEQKLLKICKNSADLTKNTSNFGKFSQKNSKNDNNLSELILEGYPDRLAKRVSEKGLEPVEYQFAIGKKAILNEKGRAPEWIIAPEIITGKQNVIYEFEEISEKKVQKFIENRLKKVEICKFVDGKIQKSENLCYGQIVISSRKVASSAEDFAQAWVSEIKEKGIDCLPKSNKLESFIIRWEFYQQQKSTDKSVGFICEKAEEWLIPFLSGNNQITEQIVYDSLYWFLDGSKIDQEVPEVIVLPNGKKTKIKYERLSSPEDKNKIVLRPVMEIIIQRIFGCFETPEICGMKVLLRLLSPASRPLQVTDDLKGFWSGAWLEICKEMKGRYPKHNWDYKVVEKD